MKKSKKQELYIHLASFTLASMRNLHTWRNRWLIWKYGNFLPELELVHNLHHLLVNPDFEVYDIYWLNTQAKQFVQNCSKERNYYHLVCNDIKELIALVPDNLKAELRWQGPE